VIVFNYHASVTFEHLSGLARDRVVNTFSFEADDALLVADADDIRARLETFYNGTGEGAAQPIRYYLSSCLSRTVKPVVRIYDVGTMLGGGAAGSPTYVRNFVGNLGVPGEAVGLPSEVSLVLGFNADFGADVEFAPGARPRARDRGRVFIGPLTSGCLTTGTANRVMPSAGLINTVLGAGKDLRDANGAIRWAVWSRTAARMRPVTLVSVDDAFDTQRRRGERPLTKTSL
jgi:hypothetical protein